MCQAEAITVNLFLLVKLVLLSKMSCIPSCVAESESSAAKGLQQNGLDLWKYKMRKGKEGCKQFWS